MSRDEVRALCTETDRWLAEERDRLAQRQAQGWSRVNKSDTGAGVVFKTMEDAIVPETTPAPEEFTDTQIQAISYFVVSWVAEKMASRDERLTKLETRVETLLALFGKSGKLLDDAKGADVVELPRGFLRRTHDAA